MFEKKYSSS